MLDTVLEAVGVMKNMKYVLGAALGLTMFASGAALAVEDISTTPHNLSNGTEGICVYCHTPHNGDVTGTAPLWNRVNNTTPGAFTMYSSPTIDMTIAGDPGDISLACLSCHDGATAYNNTVVNNLSLSAAGTMALPFAVGSDGLGNDHPISVTYDNTLDTAFNALPATLPLYGAGSDQLECATCHNPHEATNASFLRVVNTNSSLCLTCHIK